MINQELVPEEERLTFINTYPLFSLLSHSHITKLASLMYEVHVPKDTQIVTEGGSVDSFYLIYQGHAKVTSISVSAESKGEIMKAKLGARDAIGITDANFFAKLGIRTATVTALSDMVLLGISLNSFSNFMFEVNNLYPGLGKTVNKLLQISIIKKVEPYPYTQPENFLTTIDNMQEITVASGKVIFKRGEVANNFYIIKQGEVELECKKKMRASTPLSIFGETGLLELGHYQATAHAKTECKLLVLSYDFFTQALKNDSTLVHIAKTSWASAVCPKRASHISVDESVSSDGQVIYTLHDAMTHSFYRLSPEGWFVWSRLDGNTIPRDICKAYAKVFTDEPKNEILFLISHLIVTQFLECPAIMFNILGRKKSYLEKLKSFFVKWFSH